MTASDAAKRSESIAGEYRRAGLARHDLEHVPAHGEDVELAGVVLAEAGDVLVRAQRRLVHGHRRLVVRGEALHPALAEIAEEVLSLERRQRLSPVDVPADDRAALRVAVRQRGQGQAGPIAAVPQALRPF